MTTYQCPTCQYVGGMRPAPRGAQVVCPRCARVHSRASAQVRTTPASKRWTTRGRSSRQEKHNARRVGGRLTANSGAMDDKGDLKIAGLLREEDKTTKHRSFSLKLDELKKVAAAAKRDEVPVLKVCFEDRLDQQYCIIPDDVFLMLFEAYRELHDA